MNAQSITARSTKTNGAGKTPGGKVTRIHAFEDPHARVLTQLPRQLAATDVHGEHPRRAVLQQAIRKPSRRSPNVQGRPAAHLQPENGNRMLESSSRRG